jgi:GTP-binding protein Era
VSAPHRAGFVALLGRPNAGKSTLLNALLGQKLSIVSPKPQTTRHKLLGIINGNDYQLCLLDTPGWLDEAQDGLQKTLIQMARSAARDDADVIVLVVEPTPPAAADLESLRSSLRGDKPLVLVVNKCDLREAPAIEAAKTGWAALNPVKVHAVSAMKATGVAALRADLIALLPESPAFYDKTQASDRWERFFATEFIRETIFENLHEEVPHACAVEIERYKERPGKPDEINATIYVERAGQKPILLGKKGAMIRTLTEESRRKIEAFTGRKADLEIWIKIRANWRKDAGALRELGYTL